MILRPIHQVKIINQAHNIAKLHHNNASNAHQFHHLYLTLDLTKSMAKARDFAKKYNQSMKDLHSDQAKAFTLKPTHLHTIDKMLYAFGAHCYANINQCRPADHPFELTSAFLCSLTGGSASTIFRHFNRLIEAGIIVEKRYRGSNAKPQYVINTQLLVAQKTTQINQILHENPSLQQPSFSEGCTLDISFCDYIYSSLDTYINKKYEKESVVNNTSVQLASPTARNQNAGNNIVQENCANPGAERPITNPQVAAAPLKISQEINISIMFSLMIIKEVLYKLVSFTPQQKQKALQYLTMYYVEAQHKKITPQEYSAQLYQRVILKKKHLLKFPEYYMPNVDTWLNPTNPHGYVYTQKSLEYVEAHRFKKPDYYLNLKKLAKVTKLYLKEPSMDNYIYAKNHIQKLKGSKELLQIFNHIVLEPQKFQNLFQHHQNLAQ